MRPIDADALKEKKAYCVERHEKVVAVAEIDWMPTLDVMPVVRCKDCVYLGCVQCALATEYNQYRPGVDPDWFCAKGRRRKVCG